LNIISYGRLAQFIFNIGRRALSEALVRGQIVAILVKEDIFHAALILALTRLGIVTVSCREPKLPKEIRVDAVLTDGSYSFINMGGLSAWTCPGPRVSSRQMTVIRTAGAEPMTFAE